MSAVERVEVLPEALTEGEARDLTNRIRQTFAVGIVLVEKAYNGRVWLPLGYGDWAEYCDAELEGAFRGLPRGDRQEMSLLLSGTGMSTRAIGAVLGVDHKTVVNDLNRGGENSPPEPDEPTVLDVFHEAGIDTAEGIEQALAAGDVEGRINGAIETLTGSTVETTEKSDRKTIDANTGEIIATETTTKTKKVTGLDGKQYPKPEYTRPRVLTPEEKRAQEDLDHAHRVSEGLRNFLLFRNVIDTPELRADFIANYSDDLGKARPTDVSPQALRELAAVIHLLADQWEATR